MDESQKSLLDYLDILLRRKLYILVTFPLIFIISLVVIMSLPPIYKSSGVILIERQEVPSELVRSTVTSYAEQQIELIKQRIMVTSKIKEILDQYGVYKELRNNVPLSNLVNQFRENASIKMVNASIIDPTRGYHQSMNIAFTVSFMDQSPEIAQRVASELVTLFLDENIKVRTGMAAETVAFLDDEANKMQKSVQELEEKIAEFKVEFGDSLPELLQFNLSMIETLEDRVQANQARITEVTDSIRQMNAELANLDPSVASTGADSVSSAPYRYAQLKNELSELQNKYSESHPDIKRIKREIESLERELKSSRLADTDPSEIFNPIYRQLKMRVEASEKELDRLISERSDLQKEVNEYQERVSRTHQVKRAYDDLSRDHENKRAKYQELRAKQLEANVAQNLESESKAESFTLIEPPIVPTDPVKPEKPKLMFLGFVFAGAASVGLALLIEMLDPTVRGVGKISTITGVNALAVIPTMLTADDLSKAAAFRKKALLGLAAGMCLVMVFFHYFIISLDELWVILLSTINRL